MLNKLLFILFTLVTLNIATAQSAKFWITDPSIKGKLTLQNGWTLYDTTAGGVKFSGNVWIGGSQLFLGNGFILRDSAGFVILNKSIITRQSPGGSAIIPWIQGNMIADTSISPTKIKKGSITTAEIAPALRDSIFSSKTTGVLDLNIETVKTRLDKLFDSKGNFKSTVFGNTLSYDTSTAKVKIDTNYYLKARDSIRYLAGGIDTSVLLQKKDTIRFTSGTTFLPRSDTVKFLKFSDTTNFIKKSDSTRYLTKTYLDTSTIVRKADTTRYWSRANYNIATFFRTSNLDTSNLAKKSELSGSIDSTAWWNKINHPPSVYWNFNNKDTNRYYSVRNLDTSKVWNTGKNPVANYWTFSNKDSNNYWTKARLDTNLYFSKTRLDTSKIWSTNKYPVGRFWTDTNAYGGKYLDTVNLLKRNQTDVYWSRIGGNQLDTAKLTHTADSSYWRKTNFDTSKYISINDVDTNTIKFNSNKITIKDYTIDPKKIDSSKIGIGLTYNTGTGKIEIARTDTSTTRLSGKNIVPKFSNVYTWQFVVSPFTANIDRYLTRAPDINFTYQDSIGYGMPYQGHVVFMSYEDPEPKEVTSVNDDFNCFEFNASDFISVYYNPTGFKFSIRVNRNEVAEIPLNLTSPYNGIITFSIGVIYDSLLPIPN